MRFSNKAKARAAAFLWDRAIDAKISLQATNFKSPLHRVRREFYLQAERGVMAATGLDRETVRECTDFAAGVPCAGVPKGWLVSLDL